MALMLVVNHDGGGHLMKVAKNDKATIDMVISSIINYDGVRYPKSIQQKWQSTLLDNN